MVEELEWQTRRDRINKRLKALNPPWDIIKYRQGLDTSLLDGQAVEEYPSANGIIIGSLSCMPPTER
jgi:type I restriction enzyme, R subunit